MKKRGRKPKQLVPEKPIPKVMKRYIQKIDQWSYRIITIYSDYSATSGAAARFDTLIGLIEIVP